MFKTSLFNTSLSLFALVLVIGPIGISITKKQRANWPVTFIKYKNSLINPTVAILAETILTLNHYRKIGNKALRYCEQLLYIWLISHIETKKPIFNNLWWFSKKQLKIDKECRTSPAWRRW